MKYLKLVLILIAFLGLKCSCTKILGKDDVLSLEREDYLGSSLRFDGIFYIERENSKGIYFQRYALYRNGIIRHLGGSKEINDPNINPGDSKISWGVFQIHGTNIKFERWYPGSGGPFKAYIRSGIILNDTTFHISESYRVQEGKITELREKDEFYHFNAFSPKPDSTNPFIP